MNSNCGSKFLLIFGFLLALLQFNLADDAEAELKKFQEECIKEQGNLTPAEIQRINDGKLVTKEKQETSNNLQCILLCLYKKQGILNADGKENVPVAIKYMEKFSKDKLRLMTVLSSCNSQKSSNQCEKVYNMETCIMQQI